MDYHFDHVLHRRGTNSVKWNVKENELPLWIADMDFETAPAVLEAIQKRASFGNFGYEDVPEEWYRAYQHWWAKRHQFVIQKDWLIFCTGVVPAVSCAVKRMTNPGDKVLVQSPVYNVFYNSIENHGRHVLENKLVYADGKYQIDFALLEQQLSHPLTTMMILCNPHNPIGKIWNKEELQKIGELAAKHHVVVLSDEIHCDITDPGISYVPFASVSEVCKNNSITCISATKAFSIPGMQSAAVMIPDEQIRQMMNRQLNSDEVAEPNSFAVPATVAAFENGGEWLDSLREYIACNKTILGEFLEKELPEVKLVSGEATYLLWLDCSEFTDESKELATYIRKETGLYLTAGEEYRGNGTHFLRMNVACPRTVLREAMNRLKNGVASYIANRES